MSSRCRRPPKPNALQMPGGRTSERRGRPSGAPCRGQRPREVLARGPLWSRAVGEGCPRKGRGLAHPPVLLGLCPLALVRSWFELPRRLPCLLRALSRSWPSVPLGGGPLPGRPRQNLRSHLHLTPSSLDPPPGNSPLLLQEAELSILRYEKCNEVLKDKMESRLDVVKKGVVCGTSSRGKDSCQVGVLRTIRQDFRNMHGAFLNSEDISQKHRNAKI
ncbi:uncharacterized protein LOC125123105 isoform X2 [Phacochoerus africanus]|uniref:uncharacterized protein LOC125123105 isoform X2 n=1 Tax=Phacochoerus africanus TaxID=41426 RepID=UPI001FD997DE|nr:uncharacterized protein LOC125123105 isoform X2 [Phacochoerus africanus]